MRSGSRIPLLLAALCLAACATADTSDPRVCYLEGSEYRIQVSGQRLSTDSGVTSFLATISNLNKYSGTDVHWTVEFFDKDGRQVARGESHERKVSIRAGDSVSVTTQSSNIATVDFRMKVRT